MPNQEQPSTVRLFIALPVPETVKAELKKLQKELRKVVPTDQLRWVQPEQIHLTLKFLGNVPNEEMEDLVTAPREGCRGVGPFRLRAEQTGFFPNEYRPRVIWVDVRGDTEPLTALQQSIECATLGFAESEESREYSPHLTVARVKNLHVREVQALCERVKSLKTRVFGEWTAVKAELIRSELGHHGSRYTCLAEVPLSK